MRFKHCPTIGDRKIDEAAFPQDAPNLPEVIRLLLEVADMFEHVI